MRIVICFLCLGALLYSCGKCEKQCPAFDTGYFKFFNPLTGSTATYVNDKGEAIVFTTEEREISGPYTLKCKRDRVFGSCQCETTACGKIAAKIHAAGNTGRNGRNSIHIEMEGKDKLDYLEDDDEISVGVFDLWLRGYDKDRITFKNDSLIPELQIADHHYTNVIVAGVDTTQSTTSIWRIYFSAGDGVIGFSDRQTNSTFFLK
jgi:hypothetical protein